jgi:hypothetical protein
MRQRYLSLVLLAILAAFASAGCAALGLGGPPTPTPIPFDRYDAEDIFNAFARAGLQVGNPTQNMNVQGRGAPINFRSRYIFEIPRIAPNGGQVIVFSTPAQMQEWQAYINRLDSDSSTHRDVIYTYWTANLMLQMSASLTNAEAAAYRDAFLSLT